MVRSGELEGFSIQTISKVLPGLGRGRYRSWMKALVVGSCTGAKDDRECPDTIKLTTSDFDDPARLLEREKELRKWIRPACQMYTGRQHTQMMEGIRSLRSAYGPRSCDLAIVSAGYGVISENQPIAPYNITFQGMRKPLIRARGEKLGIPSVKRKTVADYPVVFFLLGDDYLRSARPMFIPAKHQKFIAFGSPKLRQVPGTSPSKARAGKRAPTPEALTQV